MAATEPSIARHLDGLIGILRQTVPAALRKWDADAIHDARVATRRMKAALDLLEPVLPQRQTANLGKSLKKLRRRLGPVRDIDVMLDHLKDLSARPTYARPAEWLRGQLIAQRDELRKDDRHRPPVSQVLADLGAWWGVCDGAADLDTAARALLAQTLPQQLADFTERAARLHAPAQNADGQDPHALRIAGKALRYTLELAVATGMALPRSILRDFKRLQDALGLWHDYVVLAQRTLLTAIEQEVAYHSPGLYEQLVRLSAGAWSRSRARLTHFAKLWAERGPRVSGAVADLVKPPAPPADPAPVAPPAEPGPPALPTPAPPWSGRDTSSRGAS